MIYGLFISVEDSLVSGYLGESKHVVPSAAKVDQFETDELGSDASLPAGEYGVLFAKEDPAELCPKLERYQLYWFVSVNRCCDTLPPRNCCIVPKAMPVYVLESNPLKWKNIKK